MAVKILVLLALVYVAQCHVVRSTKETLPAEGMIVEVILKPNSERLAYGDSTEKRYIRRTHDVVVPPIVTEKKPTDTKDSSDVPEIEDRFGIRGGNCPEGYVQRGGFCFPDYD